MSTTDIQLEEIQQQLHRLLQTSFFQHSATLSRFLHFIVDSTLAGASGQLKEYTIALHALGKKPDFNPQSDPIVRIHAGRLRRALHAYYLDEGRADPIVISIPKGTYVPSFSRKTAPAPRPDAAIPSQRRKITVAVLPFRNLSASNETDYFADGLGDHLCTELTRYSELSVISYYSSRNIAAQTNDVREAGLLLDAEYALTGTVQSDADQLRIRVQLTLTHTREQIWVNSFVSHLSSKSLLHIQDEIVWQVVSQTAGHYGAISRNISKLSAAENPVDPGVSNAIFWYYRFVNEVSEDIFRKAEAAMRQAVETDPDYALGWAVLGEVLVGGFFLGFRCPQEADQLSAAVQYGNRAVGLDPGCQHGYQTIALATLFLGRPQESIAAIREWEKKQPPEAGIMGAMGFILICCGEYDKGFRMLDDSMQLNPYYQWWFNAGLSFYYYHQRQFDNVIYWAEKMNVPHVPWCLMLKTAGHAALQHKEETARLKKQLYEQFPFLRQNLQPYASAFLQDKSLVEDIIRSLLP